MTEQQPYEVLRRASDFELRRYPEHVVAEIEVDGDFEGVGTAAFRPLVGYLRGQNESGRGLAMTAPVLQRRDDAGPPAPVTAAEATTPGRYVVSFVLPAGSSAESLPVPRDARVVVRSVPEELAVAVRYSGRWTAAGFRQRLARLRRAAEDAGLEVTGPPRFARFDPPWTPWFRRRNEVVLPVVERTLRPR